MIITEKYLKSDFNFLVKLRNLKKNKVMFGPIFYFKGDEVYLDINYMFDDEIDHFCYLIGHKGTIINTGYFWVDVEWEIGIEIIKERYVNIVILKKA